jgi:DNA polymerase-3 subunit delta'
MASDSLTSSSTSSRYVPEFHPWNQQIWQDLTSDAERSNHALLFHGPQGLGKFQLALNLAHYQLCDNHSQDELLFSAGTHPDLHIVCPEEAAQQQPELVQIAAGRYLEEHKGKPKKEITVNQIRTLNAALSTHPHIANMRIVMIANAEKINRNAANALLKSLEEPPSGTLFILVCNHLERLPATIRSRCSLVRFGAPDLESAKVWLSLQDQIPEQEAITYLRLSSNAPLLAMQRYTANYMDTIKLVFSSLAKLWSGKSNIVEVANEWTKQGGAECISILSKVLCDLTRLNACSSSNIEPSTVFFPIQQEWLSKAGAKLNQDKLFNLIDALPEAQRLFNTSVDHTLVTEQILIKVNDLAN